MNNTQKIIRLIKQTREFEAEPYFWQEKELFQRDFDIEMVVKTFQEEYDATFRFEGGGYELYLAIQKWFEKNIG